MLCNITLRYIMLHYQACSHNFILVSTTTLEVGYGQPKNIVDFFGWKCYIWCIFIHCV